MNTASFSGAFSDGGTEKKGEKTDTASVPGELCCKTICFFLFLFSNSFLTLIHSFWYIAKIRVMLNINYVVHVVLLSLIYTS